MFVEDYENTPEYILSTKIFATTENSNKKEKWQQ